MPLAEWSGKTAIEYQKDVGFTLETGQGDPLLKEILKGKIRRRRINDYFWHLETPLFLVNFVLLRTLVIYCPAAHSLRAG